MHKEQTHDASGQKEGLVVRPAELTDAESILSIYAPSVTDSPISFEETPPSLAEMRSRIAKVLESLPWFVAINPINEIVGYAYASSHRERKAYRWSVDVTVYVKQGHQGQGVGKLLYRHLIATLKDLGFHQAFAGITLPNEASVALHEAFGFTSVGVFRRAGFKQGLWRDVGWWELSLRSEETPEEPKKFMEGQK